MLSTNLSLKAGFIVSDCVAENYKLIPSVIGDMQVVKSSDLASNAVTYSGPTYVAIRSAKHTGSSAYSHLQDMKRIRSLPEFSESFKFDETEKKVIIVTVLLLFLVREKLSAYVHNCVIDDFLILKFIKTFLLLMK